MKPASSPHYSVVIEWDNPHLSRERERQRLVMRELSAQMRDLDKPAEVLIVYDREQVGDGDLEMPRRELRGLPVFLVETAGLKYYQLKNEGTRRARAPLVLFLDSDAIPEAGWLKRLICSMDDPDLQVLGGATYVEPRGWYGKTMSLCWLFPERPESDRVFPATRFFANNVCFRADVARRFPFPETGHIFRGQCSMLAGQLQAAGITIHQHSGARVVHPSPDGPVRFIQRALCMGHDHFHLHRYRHGHRSFSSATTLYRPLMRMGQSQRSLLRRWNAVGLSLEQLPLAMAVAAGYDLCFVAGVALTLLNPRFCLRCCPM